MTRSHNHELEAKEEAYLGEEVDDSYERFVQESFTRICDLFRSCSFS